MRETPQLGSVLLPTTTASTLRIGAYIQRTTYSRLRTLTLRYPLEHSEHRCYACVMVHSSHTTEG